MSLIKSMGVSQLFKSFSVYAMSLIVSSSIPFLLLPILSKVINPGEYGLVSMYMVCLALFIPFVGLSVHGALYRFFFDNLEVEVSKYVFSLFIVLFLSSILSGTILYLFRGLIAGYAGLPIYILIFLIPTALLNFVILLNMTYLQVKGMATQYGIIQIFRALSLGAITLLFVITYDFGWVGVIYALFVNNVLFSVVSLFILVRNNALLFCWRVDYIKNSIQFGLPLIPVVLKDSAINLADKFLITSLVGLQATGLYAVGYQIGSVILVVSTALGSAFSPWLFKKLSNENSEEKLIIVKITYLMFFFFAVFSCVWTIVSKYVIEWFFDPQYLDAFSFIPYLSIGFMFSAMHTLVVQYVYYERKTFIYMFATMFVLILNIMLNFLLIDNYGSIGAAYATSFSLFVMFVLTWRLAHFVRPMPWLFFMKHI